MLAQLLADDSHISVRVSVFRGTTKASPLYSVREFGNTCLLVALDRVLEYGEVINVMQADERRRTVERVDVPLFDREAWREAVINAFVHNALVGLNAPTSISALPSKGRQAVELAKMGVTQTGKTPVCRSDTGAKIARR